MSELSNNNKRIPGDIDRTPPAKTSTDSFQLNLREEDLATGVLNPLQQRNHNAFGREDMGRKAYYTERERKKSEKEHRKRNRIKAGKNKRVFAAVWIAMVLLVSFTLGSYLITGSNDFFAIGREEGSVSINVPDNVTIASLANVLEENGVIHEKTFFELYCNFTAKKKIKGVQGGTYQIDTNLDYEAIVNTLVSVKSNMETVSITFPEGLNVIQIGDLLEENEVCSKRDFLEYVNNYQLYKSNAMIAQLKNVSEKEYLLEGYLFPDTYDFYKNANVQDVINKMLSDTKKKLKILQSRLDESSYSLDQIIIMASIIQREAANVNDMYVISSVLHNRLDYGADYDIYQLQCDSTIYYPYNTKADVPENIRETYTSKYNTYAIEGLPLGAICNPGIDAIKAALMPDDTDYLYFCHDKDGNPYYASTEWEHEENKIKAGIAEPSA